MNKYLIKYKDTISFNGDLKEQNYCTRTIKEQIIFADKYIYDSNSKEIDFFEKTIKNYEYDCVLQHLIQLYENDILIIDNTIKCSCNE